MDEAFWEHRSDADSPFPVKLVDLGDGTYALGVRDPVGSPTNLTSAGTTTIATGAGILRRVICNKAVLGATCTLYDSTSGSGTKIATITLPAVTLLQSQIPLDYNCAFVSGLTAVTTGTADWTIVSV